MRRPGRSLRPSAGRTPHPVSGPLAGPVWATARGTSAPGPGLGGGDGGAHAGATPQAARPHPLPVPHESLTCPGPTWVQGAEATGASGSPRPCGRAPCWPAVYTQLCPEDGQRPPLTPRHCGPPCPQGLQDTCIQLPRGSGSGPEATSSRKPALASPSTVTTGTLWTPRLRDPRRHQPTYRRRELAAHVFVCPGVTAHDLQHLELELQGERPQVRPGFRGAPASPQHKAHAH